MARKPLFLPSDENSRKDPNKYQEHGVNVRQQIGAEGMRVIGRAYDKGIIKEEASEAPVR